MNSERNEIETNEKEVTGRRATRRDMLKGAGAFAGIAILPRWVARSWGAASPDFAGQTAAADPLAAARAQFGKVPIESTKLADNLTLLTGPGGNVVVLHGADGKLLVDTFVSSAWDRMQQTLKELGNAPLKFVIDSHWHWDHTDNNENFHKAGAVLIAHENTPKRMLVAHDLDIIHLHSNPFPADAIPQHTFKAGYQMNFNQEHLSLGHFAPGHTDSDIYIHFQKANVLHMGDVFFNGTYCYIDKGTGGSINGMIAGTTKMLAMVDNDTKIIPGHGPFGNKSDMRKFRDMLVMARDRIKKLKSAGKTMQESVAAQPFADLDPVWGKGFLNGDAFVQVVYTTL